MIFPVNLSLQAHQTDDVDIKLRNVPSLHTFELANQSYRESGREDRIGTAGTTASESPMAQPPPVFYSQLALSHTCIDKMS